MERIIEIISNLVPITGNQIVDTVLFLIIGSISFGVALFGTGFLASVLNHDKDLMSDVHWLIRVIVFLALFSLVIAIINFIKWLLQWWVYILIGIFILCSIIATVYFIKKKKHE